MTFGNNDEKYVINIIGSYKVYFDSHTLNQHFTEL